MSKSLTGPVDLTRGSYRRVYAGFIAGKRICKLSMLAEAFFWRLHAVADDFGNCVGDPALLAQQTAGRRTEEITAVTVKASVASQDRAGEASG